MALGKSSIIHTRDVELGFQEFRVLSFVASPGLSFVASPGLSFVASPDLSFVVSLASPLLLPLASPFAGLHFADLSLGPARPTTLDPAADREGQQMMC